MIRTKHWITAALGVILTIVACEVVSEGDGGDQGLRIFKLGNNEVSGWNESSCFDFNVSNCSSEAGLDGGSEEYINEGMVEGFRQMMQKTDYIGDLRIMDFGDATKATNMFNKKTSNLSDKKLGNFAETQAATEDNLSGVNAYAHFGKFYFEIQFTGYSNKTDAKSTAASFMELYENKL